MLVTIVINALSLLNCWSMIEYAGWEFEPLLHRSGIKDSYDLVTSLLFWEMIVSIVSTVLILIFCVKLLQWKKYGFWGFDITSVVATTIRIIMAVLISKAFSKIEVELPLGILIPIVWTLATIALLFAILQIKKNGVRCWRLVE
jgi:cbb3-type cytochrome oxidase subunit 1